MAKNLKNKKNHLQKEERFCIEKMLKVGDTFTKIAKALGRGLSTISEEVNLNGGRKKYDAKKAHHRAYVKQYLKKTDCNKVAMDGKLTIFVKEKLEAGWSPETISSRILVEKIYEKTSGKSIRKFINSRHGLERFLFWNRNNKKPGKKKKKDKYLNDPDRKWIDSRPLEANTEPGHWEMDFIVSKHNSYVLLVLVEKFSKKLLLKLLPNRNNDLVNIAITELLKNYLVKTITTDNDIAFQKWKELEKMLGAEIYFCHPYHSWEKGLVENMNRWIRIFISKKTNLQLILTEELQSIEDWFNHTPRQCLQGRTSYEIIMEESYGEIVESLKINLPNLRIWG